MFEFHRIPYADKSKFYLELSREIEAQLDRAWFTNLSNASAALMAHLPELNWAGFYLADDENELLLGPFQGLPACLRIAFGRGVCGTAVLTRATQLVHDVHTFPGHIACDARSQSEIVVPMMAGGRVLGVLDLDSPVKGRFDHEDQRGLEAIVANLVAKSEWPQKFV